MHQQVYFASVHQSVEIKVIQHAYFQEELESLKQQRPSSSSSSLFSLRPFVDSFSLLCVGCRRQAGIFNSEPKHPIILAGSHLLIWLIMHFCLGPTHWFNSSHVIIFLMVSHSGRMLSITCACVICRCNAIKLQPQMHGQLPIECITLGPVFGMVGVHYAQPILIKPGHTQK